MPRANRRPSFRVGQRVLREVIAEMQAYDGWWWWRLMRNYPEIRTLQGNIQEWHRRLGQALRPLPARRPRRATSRKDTR